MICFVTSKNLLNSKGKRFGLNFPCNSSSFFFFLTQIVFFLFQFQCVPLCLALISFHFRQSLALISHVLFFLALFLFVFPSLVLPFLIFVLPTYLLVLLIVSSHNLSYPSSFLRLNLASCSVFSTPVFFLSLFFLTPQSLLMF